VQTSQGIDWNPKRRQDKVQMVDVKESLGLKNTGCGSDSPLWLKQTFASTTAEDTSYHLLGVCHQEALSWGLHTLLQGTVFLGVGTNPCVCQGDGTSGWRSSGVIRWSGFEGKRRKRPFSVPPHYYNYYYCQKPLNVTKTFLERARSLYKCSKSFKKVLKLLKTSNYY